MHSDPLLLLPSFNSSCPPPNGILNICQTDNSLVIGHFSTEPLVSTWVLTKYYEVLKAILY